LKRAGERSDVFYELESPAAGDSAAIGELHAEAAAEAMVFDEAGGVFMQGATSDVRSDRYGHRVCLLFPPATVYVHNAGCTQPAA